MPDDDRLAEVAGARSRCRSSRRSSTSSATPNTTTTPITRIGSANQETFQSFVAKYLSGSKTDLEGGLAGVDKQIDAQLKQAEAGQAP